MLALTSQGGGGVISLSSLLFMLFVLDCCVANVSFLNLPYWFLVGRREFKVATSKRYFRLHFSETCRVLDSTSRQHGYLLQINTKIYAGL